MGRLLPLGPHLAGRAPVRRGRRPLDHPGGHRRGHHEPAHRTDGHPARPPSSAEGRPRVGHARSAVGRSPRPRRRARRGHGRRARPVRRGRRPGRAGRPLRRGPRGARAALVGRGGRPPRRPLHRRRRPLPADAAPAAPHPDLGRGARRRSPAPIRRAACLDGLFPVDSTVDQVAAMVERIGAIRGSLDGYDVAMLATAEPTWPHSNEPASRGPCAASSPAIPPPPSAR